MSVKKLVIGIYSLTGCEGCRHEVINLGEKLIKAIEELGIELAYEPLLGLSTERDEYDVVFIEGAITNKRYAEKVINLRRRSKYLVAMGSCSMFGGVAAITDLSLPKMMDLARERYGAQAIRSREDVLVGEPLSKYVKVDYWLRGCPINANEFLNLLKTIADGKWFKLGLRRFEFVKDLVINIEGDVIKLDGEKCIVCGRCVGVCNTLGVNALGTINRGINVAISTPFKEPFENAGCICCGLCVKYCPVGALTYRNDILHTQRLLKSGSIDAYIEPEALAALSESLRISPWSVITALKKVGFRRVVLWGPSVDVSAYELAIVPGSEAEYRYVSNLYPDLRKYLVKPPRPPRDGVLITSCVARKLGTIPVLTALEAEKMLSFAVSNYELKESRPDIIALPPKQPYAKAVGPYEVRGVLEAIRRGYIREGAVAIYICPGGCIMGGGQPFPKAELGAVEEYRSKLLKSILQELRIATLP